MRLRQSDTKCDEQQAMQPTDDGDRLRQAGEIFQRHGDAQQDEKRNSFDKADGAKPADGSFGHDKSFAINWLVVSSGVSSRYIASKKPLIHRAVK